MKAKGITISFEEERVALQIFPRVSDLDSNLFKFSL